MKVLDLERKLHHIERMGKGRKRTIQKMKNRKNQAKKKARLQARSEAVKKSRGK